MTRGEKWTTVRETTEEASVNMRIGLWPWLRQWEERNGWRQQQLVIRFGSQGGDEDGAEDHSSVGLLEVDILN